MNRSASLIVALICGLCAFQANAANAASPKSKTGSVNAAKTLHQPTLTKTKPIIDPVKGQSTLSGLNGKGSIDPGYFGPSKPSFPITFGGNPPRGPSGSGHGPISGGNPPRGPSQPSGDCHKGSHDHDSNHYCHHDNCHRDGNFAWGWMTSSFCPDYCCDSDCYDYDNGCW